MLIPLENVLSQYGSVPTGVIHVGAHQAQEIEWYTEAGIEHVVWVEANPELIPALREIAEPYGHKVIEACCAATGGDEITFHIAEADNFSNKGQSSSVLELGYHKIAHPEVSYVKDIIVTTRTLDDITAELLAEQWPGFNGPILIESDTQGFDLEVLRGGIETLKRADITYLEVNVDYVYEQCGLLSEVDPFLNEHGFECMDILLAGCQMRDCSDRGNRWTSWGDAGFIRTANPRPLSETRPDLWASWYPS